MAAASSGSTLPSGAIGGLLGGSLGPDAIAILEALFSAYTTGSGSAPLQSVTWPLFGKTFTGSGTLNFTAT